MIQGRGCKILHACPLFLIILDPPLERERERERERQRQRERERERDHKHMSTYIYNLDQIGKYVYKIVLKI